VKSAEPTSLEIRWVRQDGIEQVHTYLSMLVVHDKHRRQGVASRLVEHLTSGPSSITWVLRAGRDGAREFFASLGFEPSSIAMERRRR
jgi:GNAT superfamily N-acetyltransferase